jgi:hypothetical protein
MTSCPTHPRRRARLVTIAGLLGWLAAGAPARGALLFEAFPGFDHCIAEGSWFPVTFELFNDGPGFNASIEITSDTTAQGQRRLATLELPANTRKRLTVPVFCPPGGYVTWNFRLLDDRGGVRAEQPGIRPRAVVPAHGTLVAAITRSQAALPRFPPTLQGGGGDRQPLIRRLPPALLPDNPLVLEGLSGFYLSAQQAAELKPPQVQALTAWLRLGGHLVVAVENPGDVNGTPWLRALLPCSFSGVTTHKLDGQFQGWLSRAGVESPAASTTPVGGVSPSLPVPATHAPAQKARRPTGAERVPSAARPPIPPDLDFDTAEFPLVVARPTDGRVLLQTGEHPLMIQAPRHRGQITVLCFNPEREPFRSWKNCEWFWARIFNLPDSARPASGPAQSLQPASMDGCFGALVDSQQVRKVPVGWLLLLLGGYLLVIGPLDRYALKRINRPMLTWVTFPAYVVTFSLLVYFIGYKLRAGESEFNELHLVDVLPRDGGADWRGRTYGSIYSPASRAYKLAGERPEQFAVLRGEMAGPGRGWEGNRMTIAQRGNSFAADVFVPVWTSLLQVSDWWRPETEPLRLKVRREGSELAAELENRLPRALPEARLVHGGRVFDLGRINAGEKRRARLPLAGAGAETFDAFLTKAARKLRQAVNHRRQTFGSRTPVELPPGESVMAASFLGGFDAAGGATGNARFARQAGLDLSQLAARGDAILLAWDPGHAPVPSLARFNPRRARQDTLWRVSATVEAED